MADTKITALAAIGANPIIPATFPIPMVDLTDTSMAASGTTKKVTVNQILGAGGTATLASATITGDLTVDTNVLKVDTTNNRVGIGTASPVSSLQVLDGDITVTTGGSFCGFNGTRQTIPTSVGTQLSRLHFSAYSTGTTYVQGASVQSFSNAAWSASSAPAYLAFYTTPSASVTLTERMRIEAAGDVNIVSGNVVMATSGKGIDFAATADSSGTMTSELLNDYEEGTFTPTFTASSGTPTTVTLVSAAYTKIGRRVSIDVDFTITAIGTASGTLFLTLPFSQSTASTPCGAFVEVSVVGYMGPIFQIDATRSGLNFYNNATTWVNGYRYRGTYTYNV